jgi:hypothetical protein
MHLRLMRLSLAVAGALISTVAVSAQPTRGVSTPLEVQLGRGATGVNVGRGIICDKPEQAQRFLALRSSGNQTMQALQVVNTEASNPTACGEAMVAFRIGEPLQGGSVEGLTVNVVKITVVAFSNGRDWSSVPETVQYAIVAPQGIEV